MGKVMRVFFVLLVTVFFVFPLSGVEKAISRVVSDETTKGAGLELVWQNQLPLKDGEKISQMFVESDRIYVMTTRNYLISLNRNDGAFIFGADMGMRGVTIYGMDRYKDIVFVMVGSQLLEIDNQSGKIRRNKTLPAAVICEPLRNERFYYLCGADERIHAFDATDLVQVFEAAAFNDSAAVGLAVDDEQVVFGTKAGNIISLEADKSKLRWQFDAMKGIVRPMVMEGNNLYAASRDTNLYKLSAKDGALVWKFPAEAILDEGPVVTDKIVYQPLGERGIAAIDKESGKPIWKSSESRWFLAAAGEKSYVFGNGKLVVMNNKSGNKECAADFADVKNITSNTQDALIYIAGDCGRVECLRPLKRK
ncbi:MAG: PQQ-like beta-propeller repeat protein [Phycisphaerae bacterium]|nr:PQQ-like beta-propeller repeat protein [Phycisphaerae bacterium]